MKCKTNNEGRQPSGLFVIRKRKNSNKNVVIDDNNPFKGGINEGKCHITLIKSL